VTSCTFFWAWAAIGSVAALGLISFGLGPFASIPAAVAGVLLARKESARASAFGLVTGAGLLFLFVAWLQRHGPGITCWQTATASGCRQNLNPLPWLIAGLALIAVGVAAHHRLQRRRTH
jgi:hypothetical protein